MKGYAAFTTKLEKADAGSIGLIEMPVDVREVFGKARPPITITIHDHTWRSTISVYGGKSFIGISKTNQAAAHVAPGDRVRIEVALDTAPRTVKPPPDLAKALKAHPRAKVAWDKLSFTHKREHAQALETAKKPETRARRLASTLAMLNKT